jgi:hypothetical protein
MRCWTNCGLGMGFPFYYSREIQGCDTQRTKTASNSHRQKPPTWLKSLQKVWKNPSNRSISAAWHNTPFPPKRAYFQVAKSESRKLPSFEHSQERQKFRAPSQYRANLPAWNQDAFLADWAEAWIGFDLQDLFQPLQQSQLLGDWQLRRQP